MKSLCDRRSSPLAVLVGPLVTVVRADIAADEVRKAIDGGVKYLERQQQPDGGWSTSSRATGRHHRPVYAGPAQCRRRGRRQRRPRGWPWTSWPDATDDNLCRGRCKPWSSAVRTRQEYLPLIEPERRSGWKAASQDGAATGAGLRSRQPAATATIRTASSPCWPSTRPQRASTPPCRRPRQRPHLATGQGLLGTAPEPRRLLGLLPAAMARHAAA